MNLIAEPYENQVKRWPSSGRHILAQFDKDSVVVYQAYRPAIGHFAARYGYFGGEFKLSRMSWIKPNFLWLMYRSGWGTKPDQEVTLAITIKREAFDFILSQAVHSTFVPEIYENHQSWERQLDTSMVRLQWDPDHNPSGNKLDRRAIQLGLRNEVLRRFSREWIVDVQDISEFVENERRNCHERSYKELVTPKEGVYPVSDENVAKRLQLSAWSV